MEVINKKTLSYSLSFLSETLIFPFPLAIKINFTLLTMKTLELNHAVEDAANDAKDENKKILVDDIEEDEGILDDDDEEKALVEPEQCNDDDNTLDTTTNTNTTENTTTTIVNDSDPAIQWKDER